MVLYKGGIEELIPVRAEVLDQCARLAPESVLLTDVLAPPGQSVLYSLFLKGRV